MGAQNFASILAPDGCTFHDSQMLIADGGETRSEQGYGSSPSENGKVNQQ